MLEGDENKEYEQDNKEEEIVQEINNSNENNINNEEQKAEENKEEIIENNIIEENKNIPEKINNEIKIEESNDNVIKENDNINIEEKKENIEDNNLLKISKIFIDKTSELNGKSLYHIKGDFIQKDSQIIRRYRDFDALHLKLVKNWPGIIIPPIAQKKYFSSSTDQKVVDERIYQLENFL